MPVGSGVTVTALTRRGPLSEITLSTGRTVTMHKFKSVADLFVGHLPARGPQSRTPDIRHIAASNPDWRGQYAGRKGERVIAKYAGYDARALVEPRKRKAAS